MNTPNAPQMLASVDLGSNSFRLQICQNNNGQLQVVDSIKEMVRFAAGLDDKKYLDEASRQRALSCLSKFGERLRGFSAEQVRAVATNTFRVAKNIAEFIPQAEAALGFPIEIIAGREEARLIYTGVVHTLPPNGDKMLVVDIGGGSTEFVIGSDIQPMRTESLPLGCVTYSMRFFQNKIDEKVFQTAITAARTEIQRIAKAYKDTGWDFAVGTSGSAKSIRDVLAAETGNTEETISYPGMKKLMQRICEAGSVKKAKFAGLKADRLEVFAGGLAVMLAVFEELGVQTMTVTDAALRDGVFYDFIGRSLNEDMREQTVTQFQQRYHVSLSQADRVAHTASILLESLAQNASVQELNHWRQYLRWAAKLHEIGIDIAYTAYHKHTAYILDQADMPGFSRREQQILSVLALGQRGDVRKVVEQAGGNTMMWFALFALRLSVLFNRARLPLTLPQFTQLRSPAPSSFILRISGKWLEENPLTAGALAEEHEQWAKINIRFDIQAV
ncbi:exopolyphosphatase [Neisseria elongata]|jgi:exopolyphosphatase|uniref:Exopolyphosphatase n=2 Tax=Neisseria elongata TaxID=495 RepID=A0A9X0ZUA3_NEIEL|nr:exopolyphosphatase [Neisseria elongata]MBM7065374.1 exopolyphosphatase [Neisseria elongata]MBS9340705.1 exopolyphosphatase [Neisseria elongata subsp. nitroreducens]SFG68748.1 exopolyphosphatase / guanosine-5'-triphosphate,3'-diphosphate pyrophosphatase [Neisseria elongata subsp. elongata]STZ67087.1 exopolyphosphatase [Neisseria elongata]